MVPVPIRANQSLDDPMVAVGAELVGSLNKEKLTPVLAKFYQRPEVKEAARENGLDNYLYHQSYLSFRRYCLGAGALDADLHITLSDILNGASHVDSIFPFFIKHAQQVFPHLTCLDDLKKISDLTSPINWYPEARAMTRKIVMHVGPTNSGKTYHALERFMMAKSGVYCGPLKMLAVEVFHKTNERGTACDLVTGEERNYANSNQTPSAHVACTVEMVPVNTQFEVAVIDEIQMIRDPIRGWAWTRALLGVAAHEIHLCGEGAAIDLVKEMLLSAAEEVEVRHYKRLTSLTIEDEALGNLSRVRPGDCLVCFNKQDIFWAMRQLEAMGHQCAVIYGSLPPGTKLAQARKFNDPRDPCKVLVATDAIGMGLNLNIGRVVFYSMVKMTVNERGEKEMETISTSQALQIAGRAGRYGTQFANGSVTTMKNEDLPTLKRLLGQTPEPIGQAGLHPTADQIELYAYHLPDATLSNLMDIFVSLSKVDDSLYFMCNINDFKFLADMIQHVPLPLRARYVFCCAPISRKATFVCSMFLKFARQYSRNEAITFNWLSQQIGWPLACPNTITHLVHLEAVFDVLDLYLWLSYRFPDLFPHGDTIRDMQSELDSLIQSGVAQMTRLLINSENSVSSGVSTAVDVDDSGVAKARPYYPTKSGRASDPEQGANMVPSGRVTERLLAEGLLTPKLLDELRKEFLNHKANHQSDDDSDFGGRKPTRKLSRKKRKP